MGEKNPSEVPWNVSVAGGRGLVVAQILGSLINPSRLTAGPYYYFILMWGFIDQHTGPQPATSIQVKAWIRLEKWFSLFEWCLCNNPATMLLMIQKGGGGVGGVGVEQVCCLRMCETWISYCFLHMKLRFVCLHPMMTASWPILHQCSCGHQRSLLFWPRGGNWRSHYLCEEHGVWWWGALNGSHTHNDAQQGHRHVLIIMHYILPQEVVFCRQFIICIALIYHDNSK